MMYLGIDIGGTDIKFGVVTQDEHLCLNSSVGRVFGC